MPDFQRDITLTGGSNDYFVATGDYDYWFYNTNTNASVAISKAGKAPITISAGEVFVLHLGKGEEVSLSGTAGQTISILDHADVKLIPAARDVLGKVQIADGTTTSQLLAILATGQGEFALYDSSGNAIPSTAAVPSPSARGLNVRVVPRGAGSDMTISQLAGATWLVHTTTASTGQVSSGSVTTTAGVATALAAVSAGTFATLFVQNTDATNSVWLGNNAVTFGSNGVKLGPGQSINFLQGDPAKLFAIDDGIHTVLVGFVDSN